MMTPKILITKLLLLLLPMLMNSQDLESPCPELFTYAGHNRKSSEWYGTITLLSDLDLLDVWLRLTFDSPALQLENSFGEIVTNDNQEFFIEKPNFSLKAHLPHEFSFILKYSPAEPLPKLVSFQLNGKLVCSKSLNKTQLLADENSATKKEYPWYSVLYQSRGIDLTYVCAATLISDHYVITVAHVVSKRRTVAPLDPYNLVVYMGKFTWNIFLSPSVQVRQVSQIIPHPQYNALIYGNDIALIKFNRSVEFTDYVKAIPLWQESPDLNALVNKEGSVIRGVFDETGKMTDAVMQVKMTVVSQETCILSLPDKYSIHTSNETYCAGLGNETSLCNVDSGVGMVFPHPNSNRNNPIWQLRGMASAITWSQNQKCRTSHYVVFTDIAKYIHWIKQIITTS